MEYLPGKHLIATLRPADSQTIQHFAGFATLVDELVAQYQLVKLGEVYHSFSPGGFTAVVCLSESHISIHTWPEHQLINVDVYLSNYKKNNDDVVAGIFKAIVTHFKASILSEQTITR